MKSFLQSLLGTVVALAVFTVGAFIFLIAMGSAMAPKAPTVPNKAVLVLNLDRSLPDKPVEDDPMTALQKAMRGDMGGGSVPLPALIKALDRASEDAKISGLFITGNVRTGGAALLELRQALNRFKEKKPVLAYNQAWGKSDLYLCSGLGTLLVNPFGAVDVTAPSANLTFFAKAFEKYGIQVQVTKVGKYKSAVEPFITDKMSPENREQVRGYLEAIWDELKGGIAQGRGLVPDDIQRIADTKGALMADEAIAAMLVDRTAHYDEALDDLKKMAGKDADSKEFPQISIDAYTKLPPAPQKGKNRIAVVVAEGSIVDGEGGPGEIGGGRLSRELRAIRMDKNIKAVVMRVNSPGGSALASDLILREAQAIQAAGKPFVVSMGNVAASGGYWISTYAHRIYAEPVTITGSIGVFGMLPNARKLANNHGITFDSVQLAKIGLPSLTRPMTDDERSRIQSMVDHTYDMFLDKISDSRKKDRSAVHEIAQGRVWSGTKALELGLVDELGGLDQAIEHAAKLAKIEGDYRIDAPGAPMSMFERLMKALGDSEKHRLVKAGIVETAQNELEEAVGQLRHLNDRNGIYALAPIGVSIK